MWVGVLTDTICGSTLFDQNNELSEELVIKSSSSDTKVS